MSEDKLDRRVQRTRTLLRTALVQLIREKGYDAVTIQDITDKANLGRTTFYLHYETKDDLLLDHHDDFTAALNMQSLSPEELLSTKPQAEMIEFLQELSTDKHIYFAIKRSKDSDLIMASIREHMRFWLNESIEAAFPDRTPNIPLDALLNYIVGAQLSMLDWWLSNRTDYDAQSIAGILQQLQYAAICSAFAL